VGNVPYYITTPIIFHALVRPRPKRAVYLVQREVAERLASPPGSRTYGALSVNVQAVAEVEWLFGVPRGAFAPPPKVDSAVVRITPRAEPAVPPESEERFRAFVIDAFGARRKQMRRVLRTITGMSVEESDRVLHAARVRGEDRPEVLSAADFARLVEVLPQAE
jgi:16S rRNA (adenine1518-N6/adenine1519-N6)-dimethyltransferase